MRGITTIELLVVVLVMGLIFAVASPFIGGMVERQHVRGVADTLATDIRLARSELQRRGASASEVLISFGTNAQMSCYTVHATALPPGAPVVPFVCDCTRTPGAACLPTGLRTEIKTVQVRRTTGVSLAASSAAPSALTLAAPHGQVTPADLRIDVEGDHGAGLRLLPSATGSVNLCSPGGSVGGVPAC